MAMGSALVRLLKAIKIVWKAGDDLAAHSSWREVRENFLKLVKAAYTNGDEGLAIVRNAIRPGGLGGSSRLTLKAAIEFNPFHGSLPVGRLVSEVGGLLAGLGGVGVGVFFGQRELRKVLDGGGEEAVNPEAPIVDFSTDRTQGVRIDLTGSGGQVHWADGSKYAGREFGADHINVVGTQHNDIIRDTAGRANIFDGREGDDWIEAGGGNDMLFGGTGNDYLFGGTGDDILVGGAGADHLDGGEGEDFADYSGSGQGVTVDLETGLGSGGDAEGDRLTGVEHVSGSDHADTLLGDGKDNLLYGGGGDDLIDGRAGDDTLVGEDGADKLYGGAGDDTLIGGAGADLLDGGEGSDTADYSASGAGVVIDLEPGTGSGGDAEGDRLTGIDNIVGSEHDDEIRAQRGDVDNVLVGGAGNDRLYAYAGDDVLEGGAGADVLDGGEGGDLVSYIGSDAGVRVNLKTGMADGGHATGDVLVGIEHLTGSDHADSLIGDDGVNMIAGGGGNDYVAGGGGDDLLSGGEGDDQVEGGDGQDVLLGDAGMDYLSGGAGDDLIEGGKGADRIDGGAGQDTASYAELEAGVIVYLDPSRTGMGGDAEGDRLTGVEHVIGSAHQDVILGSGAANILSGGAGNDEIWGYDGDDVLDGGAGADYLVGGGGSDWATYTTSDKGVHVDLGASRGYGGDAEGDFLREIENLAGSDHADTLVGNSGANQLLGGKGADVLVGGAGDDRLAGGEGADVLDGGEGSDTADYSGAASGVRVDLYISAGHGGDAEGDVLTSIENLRLTNDHDFAAGTNEANRIEGLGGKDEIYGHGGDDHVDGGEGGDYIDGGDGHDVVLGGGGDDRLLGSTGDDRLEGGEGWDQLWGGEGRDSFVFKGGWGDDVVHDFADGEDALALDAAAYAQLDQAIDNAVQNGDDVVLAFDGGTVTLANTTIANVTHDDFKLAG